MAVDELRAPWSESAPETVTDEETVRQTVAERTGGRGPFLVVEEAAARYRTSEWGIRDLARRRAIPHFKREGSRRLLFRVDWLDSFECGCDRSGSGGTQPWWPHRAARGVAPCSLGLNPEHHSDRSPLPAEAPHAGASFWLMRGAA
jgi:hypothetical protein